MNNTKVCKTCGEEKDIYSFHSSKNSRQLYDRKAHCIDCSGLLRKEQRLQKLLLTDQVGADKLVGYRKRITDRGTCPVDHKWCYKCVTYVHIDGFNPSRRKRSNSSLCSTCQNSYNTNRNRLNKKRAIDYLGGECVDCGYQGHYSAFEFHHIDPTTKKRGWDSMSKHSWEKIMPELDKCVPLCACCHNIRHCTLNDDGTPNTNYAGF